jgi:hypothetical protein
MNSDEKIRQPVGRRRALRDIFTGAAVAAGVALVEGMHPKNASAVDTFYNSSDPTGTLDAVNLGTGFAIEGYATGGGAGVIGASATAAPGVQGVNQGNGDAIYGDNWGGSGRAVHGKSTSSSDAIFGENAGSGTGVHGISNTGVGVEGSGEWYGVYGTSNAGVGVQALTVTGSAAVAAVNEGDKPAIVGSSGWGNGNGIALYGSTGTGIAVYATSATGAGIYASGQNYGVAAVAKGPGAAVSGTNSAGPGVYGAGSALYAGVVGSGTGGGPGVFAYNAAGGAGIVGQSASGQAGIFLGSVTITGALTVMGAKSAAVKGADGSLRRLYCVESPESWFEDFGAGQLSGGNATVQLASDFAALVHGDSYHVFLTPEGESKGWLYVGKKTPTSFAVQEAGGGNSDIGFSYRIVAKRKDITGARLEHVDAPLDADQTRALLPTAPAPSSVSEPKLPKTGPSGTKP